MKSISWISVALGALLVFPGVSLYSDTGYTDSVETEFVEGGNITIKLSAGEHKILESADNFIRVHWELDDASKRVESDTTVRGNSATIEVDGPRRDFHTVIEVPRNSDLVIRLTAGDLAVANVGGDRDIRLRAGDLSIEVGDTDRYASVEGSLWAGDIDAGPFDRAASGLFRSIDWRGQGEQDLHFKLYAGDVTLYRGQN